MDNIKSDKYYLNLIIDDIKFIVKHTKKMTIDGLEKDDVLTYAICFKFTQISESCKKLSSRLREDYPAIPWNKISGLRNLLVHDYGHVKLEIIYDTVKQDLPSLLEVFNNIK